MKVTRMAVRVLEAEPSLAEVHLARDSRVHHPLQRPVHGRAADPLIFAADQIEEVVGGEVALLSQEDVDDQVALAGPLAAGGAEALEVGGRGSMRGLVPQVHRFRGFKVHRL